MAAFLIEFGFINIMWQFSVAEIITHLTISQQPH